MTESIYAYPVTLRFAGGFEYNETVERSQPFDTSPADIHAIFSMVRTRLLADMDKGKVSRTKIDGFESMVIYDHQQTDKVLMEVARSEIEKIVLSKTQATHVPPDISSVPPRPSSGIIVVQDLKSVDLRLTLKATIDARYHSLHHSLR